MAITLTQSTTAQSSGTGGVVPFGYASGNAGGSLLTLQVLVQGSSLAASTVTDSAGNTWLLGADAARLAGSPTRAQHWYVANAIASTNTLSIVSTGGAVVTLSMQEWDGCSTASPLVAASTTTTTSVSTHAASPLSPSQSTCLFIVGYAVNNAFDVVADPTGYSGLSTAFATGGSVFYKIATSTTTEAPEVASSALENMAIAFAAFSGVTGGAATPPPRRFALRLLGVS